MLAWAGLAACGGGGADRDAKDEGMAEVADAAEVQDLGPGAEEGGVGPDDADPGPDPGGSEEFRDGQDGSSTPIEHAGVTASERDGLVTLTNGILVVTHDLSRGTFRVTEANGTLVLDRAESRAVFTLDGEERRFGTSGPGTRAWSAEALDDALGSGLSLEVAFTREDGASGLRTVVDLRADDSYVTATTTAWWDPLPVGVRVTRLSPLVADADTGGALFIGQDPAAHRVLENGYDLYFDFAVRLHPVPDGGSILFAPGSSSNWNMAVYDPDSRRSVVAGFLSADRGTGIHVLDYDEANAARDGSRKGFTRFDPVSYYMDRGRAPLPDGEGGRLESERLYADFRPPTVHDGLESFARRYARRIGKAVRTDVPSGWNSWGGGSGSGGMGQKINEAILLENLDLAAQDFLPFGMKYFMIDDGWQDEKGDWNTNEDRFPDHDGMEGMAWMAQQIRDRGMIPGIWISPFEVRKTSRLAQEHPDWWADVSLLGSGYVPQDVFIPDLSRPEVLDWVEGLFRKVTQEWGYRWIKMDFSYFALFATNLSDPDMTPSEAYHNALARIREAIGPDTFFLMVAAAGLSYDHADGNRITLDNEPWWADESTVFQQGFKPTYATVARRYYLNHHLWINHPDLLFWRDSYGLTLEESRAWTTAVGLTGGVVKLGETYVNLHAHPEWREQVEAILPVYPRSGRPLDLFDREYPEVWDLKAEREGREWRVLGLFHWGRNRDMGGTWETPASRTFTLDLGSLGLDPSRRHLAFDAWARTWRWITDGRVVETLPGHSTRVIVLREEPAEPAVVFTTRHLLGGAVEVHDEAFTPGLGALAAVVDTVPGRPFTVFAADAGRLLLDVDLGSGIAPEGVSHGQEDGVAWLSFTATEPATEVRFLFSRAADGPVSRLDFPNGLT